jgi:transcriptional regulator with XRE-family HTH domain
MPPDLRSHWAHCLETARKAAGLTQVELAAKVGTIQQRISAWESGLAAPRDPMRLRLAKALGTTVAELFPYPDANGEGEAA